MSDFAADNITDIDGVILAIQADRPKILKNKSGQAGNQKTKYADLTEAYDVVMPRLSAMHTIWKAKPTRLFDVEGSPFVLRYSLKHLPSGTEEAGDFPLKLSENSQQMGSAITYARRYALFCVLGLVAEDEDDDGGATNGSIARQQPSSRSEAGRKAAETRRNREAAEAAERDDPNAVQRQRPPAAAAGGPSDKQLGMMRGQLNKMNVTEAGEVYALLGGLVGRNLTSTRELTKAESSRLIDAMLKANEADDAEAALIALPAVYEESASKPASRPPAAGQRPAAGSRAASPAGARSVREQTRDSVLGKPADDDERAPWDEEPPDDDGWPETATLGGRR